MPATTSKSNRRSPEKLETYGPLRGAPRAGFFLHGQCFLPLVSQLANQRYLRGGDLFLRKHFAGETEDLRLWLLPRLNLQCGLAASLFQESFAAKLVFYRDLREEEPPLNTLDDKQTVLADLYVFEANRFGYRQHGYLEVEVWKLLRAYGRESRITQGCAGGAMRNGLPEGPEGLDDSDTAAQSATRMNRYKDSVFLGKDPILWNNL